MIGKSTNIIYLFITLSIFIYKNASAQSVNIPDSIIVYRISDNDLVFDYKIKPGNTVYSISKAFKVNVSDIYKLNKSLESKPLSLGQVIKIPFSKEILNTNKKRKNKNNIFYKVGKKENLFRIAKIYFDKNVSEVAKSNNLQNYIIHPGQLLYIADYGSDDNANKILPPVKKDKISKPDIKPKEKIIVKEKDKKTEKTAKVKKTETEKIEFVKVVTDSTKTKSESKDTLKTDEKIKMASDSGKAIWNKNIKLKGVFVLNNDAKLNSLMEIYNQLVDKKIYAKVIGRIPPNTYPDNVIVILSPEAASELKALDDSFFVRINYIKK